MILGNNAYSLIMDFKDYYKTLGVEPTASQEEIKTAYHKLARLFHPDKHPGDDYFLDRFNEINEAYRNIGNLDNRLKYRMLINEKEEIREEAIELYQKKKKKKKTNDEQQEDFD